MRRLTICLLTLATLAAVPTSAFAATAAQDPDGRSLIASLNLWIDPLLELFLTYLGI